MWAGGFVFACGCRIKEAGNVTEIFMEVTKIARRRVAYKLGFWRTLVPLTGLAGIFYALAFMARQFGEPQFPFFFLANLCLASLAVFVPYRSMLGARKVELVRAELEHIVDAQEALQRYLSRAGSAEYIGKHMQSWLTMREAQAALIRLS